MGNSGFQFIDIIFFAMVAAFLVLRLRSVLGRRTGNERPPPTDYFGQAQKKAQGKAGRGSEAEPDGHDADNVVPLPGLNKAPAPAAEEGPDTGPAAEGLGKIRKADPAFRRDTFTEGARYAFEMIVAAFAQGERKALEPLLSAEVYSHFEAAITSREKEGETLSSTVERFVETEIVGAELRGRMAEITVRFVTDQINLLRDAQGEILPGQGNGRARVVDQWTFARDVKSADPNWLLIATSSPE